MITACGEQQPGRLEGQGNPWPKSEASLGYMRYERPCRKGREGKREKEKEEIRKEGGKEEKKNRQWRKPF